MATLVLVLNEIESDDKKMTLLICTQKQKQLLVKVTLMMFLNQSVLQLHQTLSKKIYHYCCSAKRQRKTKSRRVLCEQISKKLCLQIWL